MPAALDPDADRDAVAARRVDEADLAGHLVEDGNGLHRVVEAAEHRREVVTEDVLHATHARSDELLVRQHAPLVLVGEDRDLHGGAALGIERIGEVRDALIERLARRHDDVATGQAAGGRAVTRDALRAPDAMHARRHPVATDLLDPVLRRVDDTSDEREGEEAGAERRGRARLVRLVQERDLPRERPCRGDDGDEARDPVIGAFGDVEGLGIEEEHLLEVLLEAARALEIPLQRLRRGRVSVAEPALLAVRELLEEHLGEAPFHSDDGRLDAERVGRARLHEPGEPAAGAGERLEEPYADVLVDELALAGELGGLDVVRKRIREALASLERDANGGLDPDRERFLELTVRGRREERARETAVPRKAVARARELARHGERAAAELVDRHGVALARRRDGRTIEPGERLHLVPRRVAHERVVRDLELHTQRVRERLVVGERDGQRPLDPRRIMDRDPNPAGPLGRRFFGDVCFFG